MVKLLYQIGALSLLASAATAAAVGSSGNEIFNRDADAASCECTPENKVVRYIVYEMPEQPTTTSSSTAPAVPVSTPVNTPKPGQNTTATLGPCAAPDVDVTNPDNIVPATKVSLFYGGGSSDTQQAAAAASSGSSTSSQAAQPTSGNFSNGTHTTTIPTAAPASSVNMTLTANHSIVVLEYIGSIASVVCSDDLLTVVFSNKSAFDKAASAWSSAVTADKLVMITNHLGNCDAEFERGFFQVASVTPSASDLTVSCAASKTELQAVAFDCEMTFSSLPAATLTRRLTLDPSVSLTFGESLDQATTLLDLEPYLKVTADEASFTSTVTFSGYLKYNFWGFKLTDLYFDIDASFAADVAVSAAITAAYSQTFTYAPDALSYSLVSVPGIVSLGPGVAFGIGLDLAASAAVDVHAALGVALPAGNVHVDFLDESKTGVSGWEPKYTATANISEKAKVEADVSASVTVELAVEVLGGLIDLSSGLTATPRINNEFTLAATQEFDAATGVTLGDSGKTEGVCEEGVGIKSDFLFDLTGFVTKYWSTSLYSVEVPIVDKCYVFN